MLADLLTSYQAADPAEAADLDRVRSLLAATDDPWTRAIPLHVTASALIVHPPTARILLRWHERQRAWLQVGGHGDPGETDPVAVALREGAEETGLPDLAPWPSGAVVHVVIVPVNAKGDEPAHEHADVRFVLATATPDAARPEQPDAPLRWLTVAEALEATTEPNLRETINRVAHLLHTT
ncbi:NUDIX domain-containing protein [Dactylosporangium sp. AC04546]|uniref:NUDIX hydrolase n=1 Tax=Dactylosporangium sp. AC04546 TaxID=2862460 RepID=UPI001EE08072|nr:NUDIX domain-containing protein [Dactylosporangium sp. AC04546]WVK81506.1 NUDIX domain-containing protein [Dactylosporangium sp. AC04546]